MSAESPAIVPVRLVNGADVFASLLVEELAEDEPFVAGGAGSEAALGETLPKMPSRKMQTPAIDRHGDRLCVGFCWDVSTQSRFRICGASRTEVFQRPRDDGAVRDVSERRAKCLCDGLE